MKFSTKVV